MVEYFIIIIEKYAFADLFNSHLTITNSFGKFAVWQTSFSRKCINEKMSQRLTLFNDLSGKCQFKVTQVEEINFHFYFRQPDQFGMKFE